MGEVGADCDNLDIILRAEKMFDTNWLPHEKKAWP